MTLEILSGLNWLHTCGYVYSDLKPENILITSKGYLKLCDFGACRLVTEIERGQPLEGTAMYMSPELLNGKGSLTTSVDMWSLGCVVHFMCSSRPPAGVGPSLNIDEIASRVVKWAGQQQNDEGKNVGHVGGDYPSYFSLHLRLFLSKLLRINSKERMTINECCHHDFLIQEDLPTMETIYKSPPPPLPPMKSHAKSGGSGGEWSKRSFSLVVAPLPSKFVRGHTDGTNDQFVTIVETTEERDMSWVPNREQRMATFMPAIAEKNEHNEHNEHTEHNEHNEHNETKMNVNQRGTEGEQKTTTRNNGPVRSTGRFTMPPRSRGPRMMMTTRPPMHGAGTRTNGFRREKVKNKLFVKGLDLSAG